MNITVDESNMTFGPFSDRDILLIEKSLTYQKIQNNVPIAEFLLSKGSQKNPSAIWIIEAKSSSPRSEDQNKFNKFIQEISNKFINTMHLFVAAILGRQGKMQAEIPTGMSHITAANADFTFILVIRGHQVEWLPPLQNALDKQLVPLKKTWKLKANCVVVMNDAIARTRHLIT